MRRLAAKNSWRSPRSWFEAVGWYYEAFFKGQFAYSTRSYIESLIDATRQTEWPYRAAEMGVSELFFHKLKQKLREPSAFDIDYSLAAPGDFLKRTVDYLATLMAAFAEPGDHMVVMHNSMSCSARRGRSDTSMMLGPSSSTGTPGMSTWPRTVMCRPDRTQNRGLIVRWLQLRIYSAAVFVLCARWSQARRMTRNVSCA